MILGGFIIFVVLAGAVTLAGGIVLGMVVAAADSPPLSEFCLELEDRLDFETCMGMGRTRALTAVFPRGVTKNTNVDEVFSRYKREERETYYGSLVYFDLVMNKYTGPETWYFSYDEEGYLIGIHGEYDD